MAKTRAIDCELAEVRQELLLGRIVIALVHGPPYVSCLRDQYPHLLSRHGQLSAPGTYGGPMHSVVLVRADDSGFDVLDPFFPADEQPLRIADGDLDRCFGGRAIVAE